MDSAPGPANASDSAGSQPGTLGRTPPPLGSSPEAGYQPAGHLGGCTMNEGQEQGPTFQKHRHTARAPGPLIQWQGSLRAPPLFSQWTLPWRHLQPLSWSSRVVTMALGDSLCLFWLVEPVIKSLSPPTYPQKAVCFSTRVETGNLRTLTVS